MKKQFDITTTTFKEIFNEYDAFILSKGYRTTNNGKMYQACVTEFLSWLESQGVISVKHIDTQLMINYSEYLANRPKLRGDGVLSQNMINKHYFSIKLLFEMLLNTKRVSSVVYLPSYYKTTTEHRNILSVDEINELYQNTETAAERAVLTLAYGCGLRRTEIEKLDYRDVNLKSSYLTVRDGKGGKLREVPMSTKTVELLRDYLSNERESLLAKNNQLERAFLISQTGHRMRGATINRRLKTVIARSNNYEIERKGITLHNLRHSIATHLLENGAEIEFVREFLGHSEIDMVQVYSRRRKRNKIFTV